MFVLFTWLLDDDLEGYDKIVSGRRKTGRVSSAFVATLHKQLLHFFIPRFTPNYPLLCLMSLVEQEK